MGRISELIDEQRQAKGPKCCVQLAVSQYEPDDADEWRAALADSNVQHAQISRAFNADEMCEVNVSASAVSRHRKGECACG